MSDLERLQNMMDSAGIKFENVNAADPVLKVVDGYMGFYTLFKFTPLGQLRSIEAYE